MMKNACLTLIGLITISLTVSAQKQMSTQTHLKFFSSTPFEDIEANNYASVGTIDLSSGALVFSVPMQSFEFEKSLMQKHFNSKKFLNTKANPKSKLVGQIENIQTMDLTKNGTYEVDITGNLTINGVTKTIREKANLMMENGKTSLQSKFPITLADYEIAFKKGKPSTNIAKSVEVTVEAHY